ncbi:MAG: GyrI-like domain-containing protein [Alphaproteobacteria bacterium]
METTFQVKLKKIAPVKAMSIRKVATAATLYNESEKAYRKLFEHITEHNGVLTGEAFIIYHNPEYNPDFIDIEYCFVVEELLPATAIVKAREIEEQVMASVVHRGKVETLGFIYSVILDWAKDNNLNVLEGGVRERCSLNQSFDEGDISAEILVPVEKKKTEV